MPKHSKSKFDLDEAIASLESLYEDITLDSLESFEQLPLSRPTQRGLKEGGFIKPTEIQKQTIKQALLGRDILGAAKTGSGKTLAFVIPALEILYRSKWCSLDGLGVLIITPTRELAYQIFDVLKKVGKHHDFSAGLVIGGKDLKIERDRVGSVNFLICTPGRLLQHMDESYHFDCCNLQLLVLDEADRTLDLGFRETLDAIIQNLPSTKQTFLFSATQTRSVTDLARLSLKNHLYISVHEEARFSTPKNLKQFYIVCEVEDKVNILSSFIRSHQKCKMLVFLSSCKQVRYIHESFTKLRLGVPLLALHGNLHQMRRMAVYDSFCRKQFVVLFATDVASRGLDFPNVNWVVQTDMAEDVDTYVHRVGRTARFEATGESLLFLTPYEKEPALKMLEQRRVPVSELKINPKSIKSVVHKLESFCASSEELKSAAQRAFVAYFKWLHLAKDKQLFKVINIDRDKFSRSLGLVITPRVRFLDKAEKRKQIDDSEFEKFIRNESDDDDTSEQDFLTIKSRDVNVDRICNDAENEMKTSVTEPAKKPISKRKLVRKLLNKGIKSQHRIIFDEHGEVEKEMIGDVVKQADDDSDTIVDGIDIALAEKHMKSETLLDKRRHKRKLKLAKIQEKITVLNEGLGSESKQPLPDLNDISLTSDVSSKRKRRKKSDEAEFKYSNSDNDDVIDTGLSLADDETLAKKLLCL